MECVHEYLDIANAHLMSNLWSLKTARFCQKIGVMAWFQEHTVIYVIFQ